MIPRMLPDDQLELFSKFALYLTQTDVAARLGVSVRVIQYWEVNGLIHPELPQEGKIRRYTRRDLVELAFIRTMLVEHGYTIPALKEKLKALEAPYYYDGRSIFWDLETQSWKTKQMIATEETSKLKDELTVAVTDVLAEAESAGQAVQPSDMVAAVRSVVSGRYVHKRRRKTSKTTRRPRAKKEKSPAPTLFDE